MSGRSVLVTGASDPIGERLVRLLLEDSRVDQVIAVTGIAPAEAPLPADPRLRCLQVDLRKSRKVQEVLFGPARDVGVDVVVHTAMSRSAREEGGAVHAFNVEATRNLLELCERHPSVRRLVLRSAAEVYQRERDLPVLIGEDHLLNMDGNVPQWVRDRVEADLTTCARMGLSRLSIAVLRMAEVLAPGTGSQLFDYLESPVCLRPAGYDPMINVLTIEDAVIALSRALHAQASGVFNVPGADTLPLSACIRRWGRVGIPLPGFALTPLYRWRRRFTGHDFRYGMNRRRFHYSGVLDGTRARDVLGYVPSHPVSWPVPSADR
jgi:UDP-glucose 4-epimerase